jgi:hypothetical protein
LPDSLHTFSPELVQQIAAAQGALYSFILTLTTGQEGEADVLLNDVLRTHAADRAEFVRQMKLPALLAWRTGAVSHPSPQN